MSIKDLKESDFKVGTFKVFPYIILTIIVVIGFSYLALTMKIETVNTYSGELYSRSITSVVADADLIITDLSIPPDSRLKKGDKIIEARVSSDANLALSKLAALREIANSNLILSDSLHELEKVWLPMLGNATRSYNALSDGFLLLPEGGFQKSYRHGDEIYRIASDTLFGISVPVTKEANIETFSRGKVVVALAGETLSGKVTGVTYRETEGVTQSFIQVHFELDGSKNTGFSLGQDAKVQVISASRTLARILWEKLVG